MPEKSIPRAWVRQPSGRRLDLVSPTPFDWDDEDLALGLARTFRWGGHSAWPLPYSVAQHSLLVLEIRRATEDTPLDRVTALQELLHDAEEGLLGFDPISPVKALLGPEFRAVMERLQRVVFVRYGVPWWTPARQKRHKRADVLAAASEAVHVAGWTPEEVVRALGIKQTPLSEDPLARVYDCRPWEPWPSDVAADRFLQQLSRLAG